MINVTFTEYGSKNDIAYITYVIELMKQFNLSTRQVKQCIWLDLEEDTDAK